MLDAYIIDRIRREREQSEQRDARLPLPLEDRPYPEPPRQTPDHDDKPTEERGSVVIDFQL